MSSPAEAAKSSDKDDAKARMRERMEKRLAEPARRTEGSLSLGQRVLHYTSEAAYLPVCATGIGEKRDEPEAAIFTISFLEKGADPSRRPVLFAFNGGPGAAAVFLNLGALGPKRVLINDDGTMPPPPYGVVDNPMSWLDRFDLVFIDPPHTGFSTTASEEVRDRMLSVDGDIAALAECVHAWLNRHKRWNSPLYLAGESYGTTRGAGLTLKLHDMGVALSGVVLVSCAMDLQTLVFAPRNELPYSLFLPGFAGVAQYHGKLSGSLGASPAAARAAAEEFVLTDYLSALHAGQRLSRDRARLIAGRLAELTGLSKTLVEELHLRVTEGDFFVELLRDRGLVVGRLEARVTGPMGARRTHAWEYDPGSEALTGPYTMAANAYMRQELGVETEARYEVLNLDVNRKWNWNRGEQKGNSYTSTGDDLARALRRNPHLRIFVASGYYDLGTPYSATDWALAQLDAPAEVLTRLTHHYYDAGHMMYTREADLAKLRNDLNQWLDAGNRKA